MLQMHNTVVKRCEYCLTAPRRVSSLWGVKAGKPGSVVVWARETGRWLAACAVALQLGACAVIEKAEVEEAKAQVSERAQQRWDLVMKGQLDQAYEFLSPASRSTVSPAVHRKRNSGARWWRKLTLEKVDCRPDVCQVTMLLEYDLREFKGLTRKAEETWIKDGGNWWLVAEK